MIKLFVTGIVLGVAAVFAVLYFVPVVDQSRETSIISVTPNGGNSEAFHVNVPSDRILLGSSSIEQNLPVGVVWPAETLFEGSKAELFKLRNTRDAVVGVASRVTVANDALGEVVEWVMHLPARGSMYVTMSRATDDGALIGELRAGTREFDELIGEVTERRVAADAIDGGLGENRIELVSTYVSSAYLDARVDYATADEVSQ